jgi:malonate decarboxylase delta subunit
MERLEFAYSSGASSLCGRAPVLVGVVGSGNLEVLLEAGKEGIRLSGLSEAAIARFTVDTTAKGFGEMWQAVLQDFAARFCVGGLHFSINDSAATPAVVGLRLQQALEALEGARA